jgi:hypothetical protein
LLPTDFISVKLADYHKNHNVTKDSEVSLIFAVETDDDIGKFIAVVSTSSTGYRELTLGVP